MPTTMPSRTVSTVSTVRTRRYGGSTLRYGLYGTKYLLATMPTTVPTTMPGPTSTLLLVRCLRCLLYGLYGTEGVLYSTDSTVRSTFYYSTVRSLVDQLHATQLPCYHGTSWYEALQALQVLTHRFAVESRSRPQSACVAAQGHHRPRGSFSAVRAA